MNRRQLLKTLGLGAVAAPLAVFARRGAEPAESKGYWVYQEHGDVYEEGLITPTLVDNGVPYQMTTMHYQRVGNLVYVTGTIELQP